MPIKGISDQARHLPRLGKIRLGMKRKTDANKEYPTAVDFFLVRGDDGITSPRSAKAFQAIYGEKPKAIRVMFPTEDRDQFFPQWRKYYKKGVGLWCIGDGETARRRDMTKGGEMVDGHACGETCPHFDKDCKCIGSLQVLLPDVPGLGVWQIDTSSFHSITQVNDGIRFIRNLTGGRIAGIPLTLRLIPKDVSPDGRKKTVFVMDLVQEEANLTQVLLAATKTVTQLLLPEINHEEVPDDLVPASVLATLPDEALPKMDPEAMDIYDDLPDDPEEAQEAPGAAEPTPVVQMDGPTIQERFIAACKTQGLTKAKARLMWEAAEQAGTLEQMVEALEETQEPAPVAPKAKAAPEPEMPQLW